MRPSQRLSMGWTTATGVCFLVMLFSMTVHVSCDTVDSEEPVAKEETSHKVGTVIGIDLGTTYSCVAIYRDGKTTIIPNEQGNRITPSYVAFTKDGERLVGDAAKNQVSINPRNTIFDVKRLIGRRFKDSSVQKDRKLLPFNVVNRKSTPYVEVQTATGKQAYSPEEISGMVLGKMKQVAETYLGKPIKNAVVTVPAYFNDAQRQATKDAGRIAGLNVLRIINEPTAAAIAYGLEHKSKDANILVYDLGGGTFDVSILSLDEGVFEVVATAGDTHLGGEDFDQRVMDHFIKLIQKKYRKDIRKNPRAMAKLRREAEKAKRSLSSVQQTKLEVESLVDGIDFSEGLTRAKFEELNNDLFLKTLKPVARVLKDSGMRRGEINEIVLVGGSTRIPKIKQLIRDYFKKEPSTGVNPDEAVAYGAAVQGGILSGEGGASSKDILLLDVTPLSLGISLSSGEFAKIIERNSVIPTKKSEMFTTDEDNQVSMITEVFQGERARADDNVLLGEFELNGIPPMPRGKPEIEVTFEINSDGIVHVTAEEKSTGATGSITIAQNKGRLSDDEIKRMVAEAAKNADADRKFQERAHSREEFEGYLYESRHKLNDEGGIGGHIDADDKEKAEQILKENFDWLEKHEDASAKVVRAQQRQAKTDLSAIFEAVYEKMKIGEENQQQFDAEKEDL